MVINKWMSFRRTSVMVKKALELWPKSHSPFLMYPQHWVKGSLPLGISWLLGCYSAELRTAGSGTHFFEGFVRWMGLSEHWLVRLWEHGKCASSSWTVGRDFSCQSPLGLIYSGCRSPHSHGALQLRKLLLTCLVYSLWTVVWKAVVRLTLLHPPHCHLYPPVHSSPRSESQWQTELWRLDCIHSRGL